MTDITIVSSSPLNRGGLGRVTWNWATGLDALGRDVRVICSDRNGVETGSVDVTERSGGRFSYYLKDLYFSLKVRLLEDLEGEVLTWHGLGTFIDADHVHVGSVAKPLQDERLRRAGLDRSDFDLRKQLDDRLFSLYNYHATVVREASNVIAPSPDVKRSLRRYDADAKSKTTVVPPGVDESFVQRPDGVEDQVLFVGGTMPRKGVSTLLAAWAEYDGPETLVVAGYGDEESFGQLCRQHGVTDAEFRGFVDDSELQRLYRRSKAFVLPSFEEGFGIPVLEALAAETPVICSDAVGSRFVVEECDGGRVVPAGEATALRRALSDVLGDEDRRRRMGVQARRHVATNYLWKHVVPSLDAAVFGDA
jgi:glycosyltransferase involved in cell wall biosynthesis